MIKHPLPDGGARTAPIHGMVVHSTGDGIPRESVKRKTSLMQTAIDVYTTMGTVGPHYCIAPDGEIVQFREVNRIAHHVKQEHRREFLDGSWTTDYNRLPRSVVDWWQARWPGVQSPAHLYPGVRPNDVYIGVELVPAGTYAKSAASSTNWTVFPDYVKHVPGVGQRYTIEQYLTLAGLVLHLGLGAQQLVGHEDIEPYNRGGYDPGAYHGWFNWNLINGLIKGAP